MLRLFAASFLAVLTVVVPAIAAAQAFPTRPITLIVPFPPGGSIDTAARILGEAMRAPLGQPVIIENVGGAGGSIGVQRVARYQGGQRGKRCRGENPDHRFLLLEKPGVYGISRARR